MFVTKVLICGGRDFEDYIMFNNVMSKLPQMLNGQLDKSFCVIEGGATGADRLARNWARLGGQPHMCMDANWGFYGMGAGPVRNGWMLKHAQPHVVVAFPGGNGTKDMMNQAVKAGITVYDVARGIWL